MQEKLIENYLRSNSAYDGICSNPDFLEKVFQLEASLRNHNIKKKENLNDHISPIEEKKLLRLAEDFVSKGRASFQEIDQDIWESIFSDDLLFSYFQDLISFISARGIEQNKTPSYLEKIVQKRISKALKSDRNIIIALKDSLRLLNHDPENLFSASFTSGSRFNQVFRGGGLRLWQLAVSKQGRRFRYDILCLERWRR